MGTALQSKDVGELTWNDDGDTLGSGAYYAVLGTINDMDDFVTTNTGALTTTLNHNSTYTVLPTDQQGAYFNFNGVIAGIPLAFVNAHGEGDILSVTVTVSVPEPSTWAMVLIGFAGLSYAGYRTSHRTGATAG